MTELINISVTKTIENVTVSVDELTENITVDVSISGSDSVAIAVVESGLPVGGTAGQVLTKQSNTYADAIWEDSFLGKASLDFSYGDVTTQTIYQAIAGQRVTCVELGFDVAFNVDSVVSVGDENDTQRLLGTGQNNPLVTGIYSSHPFYKYDVNTDIILTIQAGIGVAQGNGTVIIYFE